MNDGARRTDMPADEATKAAIAALANARFFEGVPADVLASLAASAEFLDVEATKTVFHEGEDSSDLYILRSGALAVLRRLPNGQMVRVGEVFSGETVGEMAMLTGEPRTATAIALRDSELVRLTRDAVGALVARDPQVALAIARVLARRLAKTQEGRRPVAQPRVFAILPHAKLDLARANAFVARLTQALQAFGTVVHIDRRDAARPRAWFQQAEARHDHALFVGDAKDGEWSAFCARQADVVLLVADADSEPSPSPGWDMAHAAHALHELQRELALLSEEDREPIGARDWQALAGHDFIHHVRNRRDVARVARLLTRRATTLVLSGGGARGFAHLGVVDALLDEGFAIDIFGGSSMGAIIAAAYAGGWPREVAHEKLRKAFVVGRPLSDPIFPVVALFRGRKVSWLLRQAFGERHIEDLRQPYFCVSSCLTRASPVIHRTGLLRRWLEATVAIPGILPPVTEGGMTYVDGGVIDNLPIDAAISLLRGPVIGVDVSGEEMFERSAPPPVPLWHRWFGGRRPGDPTIMETLYRVGTIGSVSTTRRDQENAAVIIRPPVGQLGLLDWKSFDRAVQIGYNHTKQILAEKPELFAGLHRHADALAPKAD
ncbi:MAG: patatin-like phospholipase family protein [Beijerinckiaceae bacterium]